MSYKQTANELLSDEQKETYLDILQQRLFESENIMKQNPNQPMSDPVKHMLERVHTLTKFRQDKVFTMHSQEHLHHFQTIWDYYLKLNPEFKSQVKQFQIARTKNIIKELKNQTLVIEEKNSIQPYSYGDDTKHGKIYFLKEQSEDIKKKIKDINNTLDNMNAEKQFQEGNRGLYAGLYTEEKMKEGEEFLKKKRQQRIERRKRLQEQRKKQQDQLEKKEVQIKENQEKLQKAKREEILRRQKEWHEERDKQKAMRQHRNSEYLKIKKEIKQRPPLFKKWTKQFEEKHEFIELEKRQKILGERRVLLKPLEQMGLEDHEKDYEKKKQQREKQRQQKIATYIEDQAKSRVRHYSSFELRNDYEEEKERERQLAKQKLTKMKDYKQLVRERYKPKIDEEKKKELQMMIEEIDLGKKRMKRTVLENGDIVFQELNPVDHKFMGLKYLEITKQIAAKQRTRKRKASESSKPVGQHKKTVDYLQQMRKNPREKPQKFSFIHKRNISYDQKVNRVLSEAEKLKELVKNNEMKLKFGKFKTSEEILTCKEEIDQNYIDMANMKLKLIKDK